MKAGDLIFVRPHSFIGKCVRFLMGGEFSHVCMAISSTKVFEAQKGFGSRITEIYFDDYEVIPMNLTYEERYKLVLYIQTSDVLGRDYDITEVLGWIFQSTVTKIYSKLNLNIVGRFDNPKNFICLEAITYCYREGLGIELSNKHESLITFEDLLNNPHRL